MWSVPDYPGRADALRARGGEIVVVDPRRTETADHADHHLPIRPGTDVYLLAAVTRTLLAEGLVSTRSPRAVRVRPRRGRRVPSPPFTPDRGGGAPVRPPRRPHPLARPHHLAAPSRIAIHGRHRHLRAAVRHGGQLAGRRDPRRSPATSTEPGGAMFGLPPAFASNAQGEPGSEAPASSGRPVRTRRVSHAARGDGPAPRVVSWPRRSSRPIETASAPSISLAANPALSAPDSDAHDEPHSNGSTCSCALSVLPRRDRGARRRRCMPARSPLAESHFDVYFSPYAARHTARFHRAAPSSVRRPPRRRRSRPPTGSSMVRLIAIAAGRRRPTHRRRRGRRAAAARRMLGRMSRRRGPRRDRRRARHGRRGAERATRPGACAAGRSATSSAPCAGRHVARHASIDSPRTGSTSGPLATTAPRRAAHRVSGTVELAHADLIGELDTGRGPNSASSGSDAARVTSHVRRCSAGGSCAATTAGCTTSPSTRARPGRGARCEVHPDDAAAPRPGRRRNRPTRAQRPAQRPARPIEAVVRIDDRDAMRPGVVSLPHGWGHDRPGTRQSVASQHPGTT
jgi:hypothetical protein